MTTASWLQERPASSRRRRRRERGADMQEHPPAAEATTGSRRMRAIVHDRYGPPEVLRVADVERPVPKEDEVLVEVHASTVTRSDTGLRSAEYPFTRVFTGVRRPKRAIAGMEFAGVVEQIGAAVTEFAPGDEVFGIEGGAN